MIPGSLPANGTKSPEAPIRPSPRLDDVPMKPAKGANEAGAGAANKRVADSRGAIGFGVRGVQATHPGMGEVCGFALLV